MVWRLEEQVEEVRRRVFDVRLEVPRSKLEPGEFLGEMLAALEALTSEETVLFGVARQAEQAFNAAGRAETERLEQVHLARDIFGNPFRPLAFDPAWRTSDATGIAAKMYESRNFSAMPILADALEEAGCDSVDILLHCREPGTHVRGCWVVDLVLDKK